VRDLPSTSSSIRDVVVAVRQLIAGRSNSVGQVTLTAGATTTTLTGANFNESAEVFLYPRTANAAAALATTYASISRISGVPTVTITHANTGTTDRTFAYDIRGG
jgi:hypothetical protein